MMTKLALHIAFFALCCSFIAVATVVANSRSNYWQERWSSASDGLELLRASQRIARVNMFYLCSLIPLVVGFLVFGFLVIIQLMGTL